MGKLLSAEEEAELRALWARRSRLHGRDLERLCRLIMQALRRCAAPELQALRETEDLTATRNLYIQDFLLAKVLDSERFTDSPLESVGALVLYFRNFLRSAIEASSRRKTTSLDEERETIGFEDDPAPDNIPEASGCGCSPPAFERGCMEKAREFVRGIEKRYQVLLLSYCADEPVFKVAKRYNIASAAHHAGKLGITKKHGGLPPAFGETMIGRWMIQALQIDFSPDSIEDFRNAIESLCAASFELRQELEAGINNA